MNRAIYITLIAVSLSTSVARADIELLNDLTLPESSDGFNITRDTTTQLEWLDLDVSAGRTFDDLIGSDGSNEFAAGGDFEGFRYATNVELIGANNGPQLDSLYKSLMVNPGTYNSIGAYDVVRSAIVVVGCFGSCDNYGYAYGTMVNEDGTEAEASLEAYTSNDADWGRSFPVGPPAYAEPNNMFPQQKGNWLVRDVVFDQDGDGVADELDNCQLTANADQIDTNGDGYGNACDPDLDNNGTVNFVDVGLWAPQFGMMTSGDADFNGDGVANFLDFSLISIYCRARVGW